MRKDKPELFELLRTNKSKLNSTSPYATKEEVATHTAPSSSESAPIPYHSQPLVNSKAYPKLKMPFPTNIKGFHPLAKSKEQTFGHPSTPDKTARYQTQEKKKPINYSKFFIPTVIVAALIIVAYLIFVLPSQDKQPTIPTPSTTDTNNNTITATNRFWSNMLIYYKDNAEGQSSCNKRLTFLMDKNISGVFTRKERIQNSSCIVIYAGKYRSLEEAKKEHSHLKQLHYAFKNLQAVELGEK
ncbi:MAG: hypothetical protein V1871_03560 [Planctomycetota bacterium]